MYSEENFCQKHLKQKWNVKIKKGQNLVTFFSHLTDEKFPCDCKWMPIANIEPNQLLCVVGFLIEQAYFFKCSYSKPTFKHMWLYNLKTRRDK